MPPTFRPFDSAVEFHKSLSSSELNNATMRLQLGELATALYTKDKKRTLRSIKELQNLCLLSKNESAGAHLRSLSKSVDGSWEPAATAAILPSGGGNASTSEDAVRFSAAVQSQLYDVNAAPNETPRLHAPKPRPRAAAPAPVPTSTASKRRDGGGDNSKRRRGPRGGGPPDKPPVPKDSGRERSKVARTQRVSDRPGNVPSGGMEKDRRKGGK
jgi:hypothetical protein